MNFSTFVNGLRAEQVAERLKAGDRRDLLQIAFEAGFASKASFNRAFKARLGSSPSAYRRQVSDHENLPSPLESEARPARSSAISAA